MGKTRHVLAIFCFPLKHRCIQFFFCERSAARKSKDKGEIAMNLTEVGPHQTPKKNAETTRDVLQILAADVAGKPKKRKRTKMKAFADGGLEFLDALRWCKVSNNPQPIGSYSECERP